MKNQISEDIKRAICKRNNYETAKKLLDDYYYDQCGHIDAYSRDSFQLKWCIHSTIICAMC